MTDQQTKQPKGEVHEPKPNFSKVPELLIHNLSITDGAVRLYGHMYGIFWKYGSDNEGQTSMAEALGVSEATIVNRIQELEYHDWLVVVEQGRDKQSGNYLPPYYHVFVEQKDAETFRKNYKCGPDESIRPKPTEVREKKSRKGKGGKPENLKQYKEINRTNSSSYSHTNSSWDGDTNSSSDRAPNSSWSELDSIQDSNSKDLNTNTPHTPAPNGLGSGSAPSNDPMGLKKFYANHEANTQKLLTANISENQAPTVVEEKSQPAAQVATPPPPSSAPPPASTPDAFDMTHLSDVVANKWFDFNNPTHFKTATEKTKNRIHRIEDTIVETFPDVTDDRHAFAALEFAKYWSTKKDRATGQPLSMPTNADSFSNQWRKWLNDHPDIARQVSGVYAPETKPAPTTQTYQDYEPIDISKFLKPKPALTPPPLREFQITITPEKESAK